MAVYLELLLTAPARLVVDSTHHLPVTFSPPLFPFPYFLKATFFLQWFRTENPASPLTPARATNSQLPWWPLLGPSAVSYFLFSAAWIRLLEQPPDDFTAWPETLLHHPGLVCSHLRSCVKHVWTTPEPVFTVPKHMYLFVLSSLGFSLECPSSHSSCAPDESGIPTVHPSRSLGTPCQSVRETESLCPEM